MPREHTTPSDEACAEKMKRPLEKSGPAKMQRLYGGYTSSPFACVEFRKLKGPEELQLDVVRHKEIVETSLPSFKEIEKTSVVAPPSLHRKIEPTRNFPQVEKSEVCGR